MFVDASALTAMLTDEHDSAELAARLEHYAQRTTSPIAVWETVLAVARIVGLPVREAEALVDSYLKLMSIKVVAIPAEICTLAIDAFNRYGKSRHPAALNMGDCFAYACARHSRVPLLYKGEDFARTDIETG